MKCSPSHGNAVYHSYSAPAWLVKPTDTKAALYQHVSVPTHDHHQRALPAAKAMNKKKTTNNPRLCSFLLNSFDRTSWMDKRALKLSRWKQKYKQNCQTSFELTPVINIVTRNTFPEKCRHETKYITERHCSWTVIPALPLTFSVILFGVFYPWLHHLPCWQMNKRILNFLGEAKVSGCVLTSVPKASTILE